MDLSGRFLVALVAQVQYMAEKGYFAEKAGNTCPDGHLYGLNDIRLDLAIRRRTGMILWPIHSDGLSDENTKILVEALYEVISKPDQPYFHQYCGEYHSSTFTSSDGRYDYTVYVNEQLARFKLGYRLDHGKLISLGTPILHSTFYREFPQIFDQYVTEKLNAAYVRFIDSHPGSMLEAVSHLSDAYDRIKSLLDEDKKISTERLAGIMSTAPQSGPYFNSIMKSFTDASNKFNIRHHEQNVIDISGDIELQKFLFYGYLNLIVLAAKRLENFQHE